MGYWTDQNENLCDRSQAGLPPLRPQGCVWVVKQWFNNGSILKIGIRANPEDMHRVNHWATPEECLTYLYRLQSQGNQVAIEAMDGSLRKLS